MNGILEFIGGVAFFLFGMTVMSRSLQAFAGEGLSGTLARLCRTPLRGVAIGTLVTAAIQSSSATTVMVVGLVNAGVMTLHQAVGVIMGANLGTTLTAWLLSLSALGGAGGILALFRTETLAPLLALAGVFLMMAARSEGKRQLGSGLAGLGVLFAGMEAMTMAVAPLADNPQFAELLTFFGNPLAGVLAGAVMTAVLQSSSAAVGILQSFAATGVIGLGLAVPVIMGQNIGTCVTALLSSVGTEPNARRAALIHLYFNLAGTAVLLPIFYILYRLGVISPLPLGEGGIALVHTAFNLLSTALLLPLSGGLLSLATRSVPEGKSKRRLLRNRER